MALDDNFYRFKLVLFGAETVGKTSLVDRYINDKFEEVYISTLGYNVYEKTMEFEGIKISFMIYDIGGQEKFRPLRKKYAQGADVAIIIYDITSKESFDRIPEWKRDLQEFTEEVSFIIVGNKKDLEKHREVPSDTAKKLAAEIEALDFFETSAKTGRGVNDAFEQLALKTYEHRFKNAISK
jgi:small GTP-binding protein